MRKVTFDLGGYELEITQNGFLLSPDGQSGGSSKGDVGFQVIYHQLPSDSETPLPTSIMQAFLKPSQARAVASALLSAATEAQA